MGRRKIEIKAIKDDRNRSVTFLKRKGGLFKKAHELSVLCSVDVAVFIFGSNKKLYEYSSSDMRDMVTRYTYHQGPSEHKGPSDFNGGADDDDDEDGEGTPPNMHEGSVEPQMMPPHFQSQPPFGAHLRGHTPSASPPINGMGYIPRTHTPQPMVGSRPSSRSDFRRSTPHMPPGSGPPGPPQPVANGYAYMPQPPIYSQPPMTHHGLPHQQSGPYPYQPPPHAQMQHYVEEQRQSSLPPSYPPQVQVRPPSQPQHPQPSPQPHPQQLPQQHPQQHPQQPAHMSPPQPQHQHIEQPQPPRHLPHHVENPGHTRMEPPRQDRLAPESRPSQPLLDTSAAIKKLPNRSQGGSIFTPVETEGRSILGQHLASFGSREENASRSQSVDVGTVSRSNPGSSPPQPQRSNTSTLPNGRGSISTGPDTTFAPPSRGTPSRSDSLKTVGGSRPRLKVQIPDEASEAGSNAGTAAEDTATTTPSKANAEVTQGIRRNGTEGQTPGVVLPPPSPSASALLSAGASGPPNPFARPLPQASQHGNINIETPASALPSRMMGSDSLGSPSAFFGDWGSYGRNDSNTLPSPLNFATPVTSLGPSFLRDDGPAGMKRKSPDMTANGTAENHENGEAKRLKISAES